MHTWRVASMVVFVILVGSGQVSAQVREMAGSFSISPFGGAVIPIGDFADNDPASNKSVGAKTGFGLGAAVEYGLTENLAVGGRFSYNRFGLDEAWASGIVETDVSDGDWTVVEIFGAYLKLLASAGKPTRPFVRAGVFAGKPKLTADATEGSQTAELEFEVDNSLGIDAGVGVSHMFSEQIGGFVEGSIAHLMTDEKTVEFLVDGVNIGSDEVTTNLQWITVRAGLTIFLGK